MKPLPIDPADAARAEEAGIWCMRHSEGQLVPEDRSGFQAWLEADSRNREAFDCAVMTWKEVQAAEASDEFLPLRIEALASARRAKRARSIRILFASWPRAAAVAAVVLIVAAVGTWTLSGPDIYETGIGERRTVMLSDGSRLSLDAASRVEVNFRRDRRDLRLREGRAKFDVAKDPLRSFAVAAANRVVVATGTEFSVELIQREVHVVLYEGHVSVFEARGPTLLEPSHVESYQLAAPAADIDRPKAGQDLVPGRELVASTEAPGAQVSAADPTRSLLWESGQLVFIDEPLSSAVERVNRYAKKKLEIGDPRAAEVRVTGIFTAGDTTAFVEGTTAVFPVRLIVQGDRHVFVFQARTGTSSTRSPG